MSEFQDKFVEVKLSAAAQRLLSGGAPAAVIARVRKAIDHQNEITIGATVEKRMSFPRTGPATREGLRVQTGRLRRSLTRSAAQVSGDSIVSAIGSNVSYFGAHEFGFDGNVTVRSHTRRRPDQIELNDGSVISQREALAGGHLNAKGGAKKGRRFVSGGQMQVRSHSRHMKLPARMMVRKTVNERIEQYRAAIEAAVAGGLS